MTTRNDLIKALENVFDSVCVWRRSNAAWIIYTETCKIRISRDGHYTVNSEVLNPAGVSDCGFARCYGDAVGTAKALYC